MLSANTKQDHPCLPVPAASHKPWPSIKSNCSPAPPDDIINLPGPPAQGPPLAVPRSYSPVPYYGFVVTFSFVGTMLLICGLILFLVSPPSKHWTPTHHNLKTSTVDDGGYAAGTTAIFPVTSIGVALLSLGAFAYMTAIVIHCKGNCNHQQPAATDASRQNYDSNGGLLLGPCHVPAVKALPVGRPYTEEFKVVLVPLASTEESEL